MSRSYEETASRARQRALDEDCRCERCRDAHSEFIGQFGKWPSMGHVETMELVERRRSNERSWDRAMRGDGR